MSSQSFVYRHILIYRLLMNILYLGKYKERFFYVIDHLKNLPKRAQILELCFGDTYIAEYCKETGYAWKGIDLNKHFVQQAKKMGYDAHVGDLTHIKTLPKAEACIIIGSLYHFHQSEFSILSKMFEASNLVVISEPVLNLSASGGIVGFLAKRGANTGKGNEEFRYNQSSLLSMLKEHSSQLNYKIDAVNDMGKDLIVKLQKNGNN